jgi:hypothetical protein
MKHFINIDLIAGVAALAYAVLSLTVLPALAVLAEPRVAGAFGLAALARGYFSVKAANGAR